MAAVIEPFEGIESSICSLITTIQLIYIIFPHSLYSPISLDRNDYG